MKPNYIPNKYILTTDLLLNPNHETPTNGISLLAKEGLVTIEQVSSTYPINKGEKVDLKYSHKHPDVRIIILRVHKIMYHRKHNAGIRATARDHGGVPGPGGPRIFTDLRHIYLGSTNQDVLDALDWLEERGITNTDQLNDRYPRSSPANFTSIYRNTPEIVIDVVRTMWSRRYNREYSRAKRSRESPRETTFKIPSTEKPEITSQEMSIVDAARLYPHLKIKVHIEVSAAAVII